MGLELKNCRAIIKGVESTGNLHVDSKQLEFRATEIRWVVPTGKGTRASADAGELKVSRGSKSALFLVGGKAEKWVAKILHPPSLTTKLGLKPELRFVMKGDFDTAFRGDLTLEGLRPVRSVASCDIVFVKLQTSADLKVMDTLLSSCQVGTHVWAVWPKGVESIRQSQVIATAKEHGIGPGKGISFDDECSAMRFTKK